MDNAKVIFSGITPEQIQGLSKKELSMLIFSVIKVCNSLMTNLDCLEQVSSKLNVLNDMKPAIDDIKSETGNMSNRIQELEAAKNDISDTSLLNKLKQLDQKFQDSIQELGQAQVYNQKLLEEMDAVSRRNNLIITGLPEGNVNTELGSNDIERVECLLQKTGATIHRNNFRIRRLGRNTTQTRPILVTLDCHETCREIRINSNKLKEVSGCASIFIRRDIHPTLRYEANRLRIKEREEKAKPENIDASIIYDRKERVLLKDGEIIDKFRPAFQ